MDTNRRWASRHKKLLVCAGLVILVVLGAGAFFRVWRLRDVEAYVGMAGECHPVWKEFAFRRFGAGDSASNLLEHFPPTRREEFGRYGVYHYQPDDSNVLDFTGFTVVARDGRLLMAAAHSDTWQFTFFETEGVELDRQYMALIKERHRGLERKRLGGLETELQKFYLKNTRWPTNQEELYYFVNGKPSGRTNSLGVTLVERSDGGMDIGLIEFPDEKRSAAKLHILP